MKVLAVNAGSSSIRLDVFGVERAGPRRLDSYHGADAAGDAAAAVRRFLADAGVDAVAHRVVHGGASLVRPCLLEPAVEREIERLAPLAPLHNPAALAWLRACRDALGDAVPQVAVFDTAFFAGLPRAAHAYALPRALVERHGLRRYGFHGIAHEGMWRRWRALGGGGRMISLQLGAGCSIAAVRDGAPLDTSMGFSPLEGLVMATRCGDVDPGLLLHLQRAEGLSPARLERLLNEESGLLGIAGSADMRAVLAAGEPAARLAVETYCLRARKYVAAYLAVLGGADAIVFGGGVGANAAAIRAGILSGMEWAGIALDAQRNGAASNGDSEVHAPGSRVQVHVLPADEASLLAESAAAVIGARADRSLAS